jgi:hypothetical protein
LRAAVQFLLFPLALLPLLLAFVVRYQLGNLWLFGVIVGVAGVLGLGLYLFTLRWVSRLGEAGREQFVAHLSQGEGPIASE